MRKVEYIATDFKSAINANGVEFVIGEIVAHQDQNAGTTAITKFTIDPKTIEVLVHTTKGVAHLDFVEKLERGKS